MTFVLARLTDRSPEPHIAKSHEALIGQRRVHSDWHDPRDHLRDRMRRAVSRGRALMSGGYLDFLV
ncbi:DUF2285 domain-containing protein [Mesorhizobium sp. M0309]|uniref:DNA -binding domain-containing protein n=1 Tax=Mesorhizobium sp. M0309 TaxID=2956933 RepID=UPI00333A3A8D